MCPTAIDIDPRYSDQLWVKDCRFENICGAGRDHQQREESADTRSASRTPSCATCRSSRGSARAARTSPATAPMYRVANFNYGLILPGEGDAGHIDTLYERRAAERDAGAAAAGDRAAAADARLGQRPHARRRRATAQTDDTAAIQKAIDAASRALLPDRLLHRPRHDHAEARHRADRAASRADAVRSAGRHARLSGRRRAEGGARSAARRHQHRERPRHLRPAASIRARRAPVDGGRAVAHRRRAVPAAATAAGTRSAFNDPHAPIRDLAASAGAASIRASG